MNHCEHNPVSNRLTYDLDRLACVLPVELVEAAPELDDFLRMDGDVARLPLPSEEKTGK